MSAFATSMAPRSAWQVEYAAVNQARWLAPLCSAPARLGGSYSECPRSPPARYCRQPPRISQRVQGAHAAPDGLPTLCRQATVVADSHNWRIKNVLVEGSPMIIGGPKKAHRPKHDYRRSP